MPWWMPTRALLMVRPDRQAPTSASAHVELAMSLVRTRKVKEAKAEIDAAYAVAAYTVADRPVQFFWLGALLQISPLPAPSAARTRTVVVIRSA